MKFKKDSKETEKYLESVNAFYAYLLNLIKGLQNLATEHPKEVDSDEFKNLMSYNEKLIKYSNLLQEIMVNAAMDKSMYTHTFSDILKGKTELEEEAKLVGRNIGKTLDPEADDDHTLAMAKGLSFLEDALLGFKEKFAPVMQLPDMEVEQKDKPSVTTKKEVNHKYMKEYIEEFKRLKIALQDTNPWYSKGSPSYQAINNSMDGFVNRLSTCTPEQFNSEFKKVINEFNNLAADYREAHKNVKLDNRQMKRLKIMNRIYMLGETFDMPGVNPSKDYTARLAEKMVHAEAITALKKNPNNIEQKNNLLYPSYLAENAGKLARSEVFNTILPKDEAELRKMLTTNGEKLYPRMEKNIQNQRKTLAMVKQFEENFRKQVESYSKTNQKTNVREPDKIQVDDLDDDEIARIEEEFKRLEEKQKSGKKAPISNVLINNTIVQPYQNPKEKRQNRMAALPNGGQGTSDEVLNSPEMEALEKEMLKGAEYNYSGQIPNTIRSTSSIRELENFKETHPNLSTGDKQYIDSHIATEKFYKKLEETKITAEPKGPVTRNDGTVILEHIHLDTLQNQGMGCYSCSAMLLLQSRGLNLDQRQIRNYRMESSNEFSDFEEKERTTGDVMGNIINIGGIATRCLTNTAVHERTYTDISTAGEGTKLKVANDIRNTVIKALNVHKSPISVLKDGHYITVVGYNPNTDTLVYKNSMVDEDQWHDAVADPDKEHHMKVSKLLNAHKLAIGHLMTINPENPMEHFGKDTNIEFVEGQYLENNPSKTGAKKDHDNPDGKLIWDKTLLGNGVTDLCGIQSVTKVPKQLVLTRENVINNGNKFKVIPFKNSPEKHTLLEKVEEAEKKIFPDNAMITINGYLKPGENKWADLSVKCNGKDVPTEKLIAYLYLQKVKAKIDILTPWQTKHALDQERFNAAYEGLANNDAFPLLISNNGKTVNLKEFGNLFVEINKELLPETVKAQEKLEGQDSEEKTKEDNTISLGIF